MHSLLRLDIIFLQQEFVEIQATTLSLSKEEPVRHIIQMYDMERKEILCGRSLSGSRRRGLGSRLMSLATDLVVLGLLSISLERDLVSMVGNMIACFEF
jgi:hypothetical protein